MKKELVNQLIYRFMRIGLLPLLFITGFAGIVYARPVHGQEILDQNINLLAGNKEVKTVVNEISRLTDIKFVYSSQRIPARQRVSVIARNLSLREVLEKVFQPLNILYYVSGRQIVLMQKGDPFNLQQFGLGSMANSMLEEPAPVLPTCCWP